MSLNRSFYLYSASLLLVVEKGHRSIYQKCPEVRSNIPTIRDWGSSHSRSISDFACYLRDILFRLNHYSSIRLFFDRIRKSSKGTNEQSESVFSFCPIDHAQEQDRSIEMDSFGDSSSLLGLISPEISVSPSEMVCSQCPLNHGVSSALGDENADLHNAREVWQRARDGRTRTPRGSRWDMQNT